MTTNERHQIIISADGHCGAHLRDYKNYLDPQYRGLFDDWADNFHDAWNEGIDQDKPADRRAGVASAESTLNWDSDARIAHLDSQGIAAEVLFPNTAPPFYPSGVLTSPGPRNPEEYELRFAGLRAHNRWLAEFCQEAPERRAGFAQVFLDDIDDAVAEVRWAKDNGLSGILVPGDHVLKLASLYYPTLDPLWAVCEELDMPVHKHAAAPTEDVFQGGPASQLIHFMEIQFFTSRAIPHMILSGVFERFPALKFVTTEIPNGADVANVIARMDGIVMLRHLGSGTPLYEHIKDGLAALKREPSEYYATNCYIGGPLDFREALLAGVPNLMWGADSPHSEGTDPFTHEALRAVLWDATEEDRNVMVATRAAEVYGFDLDKLQVLADQICPTVDELSRPVTAEEWPNYPADTYCSVFRGGPQVASA